ncbi:hypothetical protein SXY01_05110 [Staphylococcus xylosus]|nr:hypothetical protein SXY01_05110 [Staphylococcus xylosus]
MNGNLSNRQLNHREKIATLIHIMRVAIFKLLYIYYVNKVVVNLIYDICHYEVVTTHTHIITQVYMKEY